MALPTSLWIFWDADQASQRLPSPYGKGNTGQKYLFLFNHSITKSSPQDRLAAALKKQGLVSMCLTHTLDTYFNLVEQKRAGSNQGK